MIAIGSDHGGFNLKQEIINFFEDNSIEYKDFGTYSEDSVDYPEYASAVTKSVLNGTCKKGIVICGTGIGISIAANKTSGIRCALCHDCFSAEAARLHNNANVLALGGRVIGSGPAIKIVDTFISTSFSNDERHKRRINKIEQ